MKNKFCNSNNTNNNNSNVFYNEIPEGWNLNEENIIDIGLTEHAKKYN